YIEFVEGKEIVGPVREAQRFLVER
ncbi:MAG: hypothetical protein JWR33_277, partial [Naasia sp.]|nr:hypothetical protein [Naasia sp.]